MLHKPTSAFRLSKEVKRRLASYTDAHKAGNYKRDMIEAQLYAEEADRKPIRANNQKQED